MRQGGVRGDRPFYNNHPPLGPHGMPYHSGYGDGSYGYGGCRNGPPPRPGPYSRPYGYDQRPPSPIPPRGPFGPGGVDNGRYGSASRGGGRPLHMVRMRGLPFQATTEEISAFFTPVQPVNISIHYNVQGRPNGEADAEFATHDEACEAMKKDRERMGSRYIELFLESCPDRPGLASPNSWNYGPPFFSGGSAPAPPQGANSNIGGPSSGRYGGPPPLRGNYYDPPNDNGGPGGSGIGYYGSGGDYGYSGASHSSQGGGMDDRRYGDAGRRGENSNSGNGGYGGPSMSSSQGGNVDNGKVEPSKNLFLPEYFTIGGIPVFNGSANIPHLFITGNGAQNVSAFC